MKQLLLLLPLLGGCTYYFDTGLDRQLSRRVEERLKNDEGLPLEEFSSTPPVSVEQALPKFKEGRPPSGRTLPPEKPVLSGAEGPVLMEPEEVARTEVKVPDTPPVLKAQPNAGKPLSLDPVDKQIRESNRQTEQTTPPIQSKAEGAVLSGAEGADGPLKPKAKPESTQQLSIAQARTLALENNLDLKIAQVDPKLAATAVSQEQAKFDDLIFARAKYSRKQLPPDITEIDTLIPTDPTSPSKGTTVLRVDSEQLKQFLDIDAGISIPLRTGGKITLSVPFDEKSVAKKGFEQGQYAAALRFSISQPLLRGGGIDNNVAGIRIAQYEQQAVDVKTRLQSIRVLAAVERAYWGVYVAWGELDVRLQQYENAADNLAMVKKRVAAGLTAAVELNRAEIGVAERMEGLIVTETTLKIRERQLKLFLNDPMLTLDSSTLLVPDSTPTLVEFKFDREQLAQRALAGRLELLELELKLAADLTKIDYLRNQTLPMFMLDYSYGTPRDGHIVFRRRFRPGDQWRLFRLVGGCAHGNAAHQRTASSTVGSCSTGALAAPDYPAITGA